MPRRKTERQHLVYAHMILTDVITLVESGSMRPEMQKDFYKLKGKAVKAMMRAYEDLKGGVSVSATVDGLRLSEK